MTAIGIFGLKEDGALDKEEVSGILDIFKK
jgi:hypothetical protein